mmetsp:Transcript_23475/g.79588  ORF Transcript_23475/g.79588 Transcript_23475/m.79588 type:complete len:209 (-) Transcript_23475:3938-4564(-)
MITGPRMDGDEPQKLQPNLPDLPVQVTRWPSHRTAKLLTCAGIAAQALEVCIVQKLHLKMMLRKSLAGIPRKNCEVTSPTFSSPKDCHSRRRGSATWWPSAAWVDCQPSVRLASEEAAGQSHRELGDYSAPLKDRAENNCRAEGVHDEPGRAAGEIAGELAPVSSLPGALPSRPAARYCANRELGRRRSSPGGPSSASLPLSITKMRS